jgi:hypothetical protein
MFSIRNKITLSYIDNGVLLPMRYRILTNTMSRGPWHLENSHRHILAVNTMYFFKNKNLRDFTLRLDNCDIEMLVKHNSIRKSIKLNGYNEDYFCKVTYALENKELTYVRVEKNEVNRYFYDEDENLKFTF